MNQPVFTFLPQVKYLKPHNPARLTRQLPPNNAAGSASERGAEKPARPVLHLSRPQVPR